MASFRLLLNGYIQTIRQAGHKGLYRTFSNLLFCSGVCLVIGIPLALCGRADRSRYFDLGLLQDDIQL